MFKRSKIVLSVLATSLLMTAAAEPALAQNKCTKDAPCTLRIRTVAPKASPWGKLLVQLAKELQEETDKRLDIKIYWQSKSEEAAVRQCAAGKIGGIGVSMGALASSVPELSATEMPFLFKDYREADKALDAAQSIMAEAMLRQGFVWGLRGENGFRQFASTDSFFQTPGSLKGKAMRSQPADHHIAMYKALGANPNPIQVAEVSSSLSNGTVTGYDNTLLFGDLAGWADEVKYITMSSHIYQGAVVAWCKGWYDTLDADIQAALSKSRPKLQELGLSLVRVFNDKRMPAKYAEAGKQIKTLSASERAAFVTATASVEASFKGGTTELGRKLLDTLKRNR